MSDGEWTWELASKAQDDLTALNSNEQQRIIDKLNEIIDSPWRDPPDHPSLAKLSSNIGVVIMHE
ncbi:hypothetical protein QA600_10480, partial [Natronococcus sp. A-GB1]|nr:hypothetical protein [Natronococcus sp. A-GB1]